MITFPSRERATRSDSMPTDTNTSSSQPQQSNPPKRSKSKSRTRSEKNQDDPSLVSRKRANSESATPKRSHSKKDKINAVSKASLAMLDPRHAMGMDSEYGQESYFSYGDSEEDPKEREEYDGIWGEEKSMGGGGEINNNQAGRGRKNAAATLPKWSDQRSIQLGKCHQLPPWKPSLLETTSMPTHHLLWIKSSQAPSWSQR